MALLSSHALWFLPFVLPICLYVAYTDLARMKITNKAVTALALVFLVIGFFLMPFSDYLWRLAALVIVLIVGIVLNAVGVMGAGDAKFMAAAAPFIALGDLWLLTVLFMITLTAALIAHKIAKHSPLRNMAPDWVSWDAGKRFPMGLALGPTLAIYLGLGTLYGS